MDNKKISKSKKSCSEVQRQIDAIVSSFIEIIKRIEHDEFSCRCPICHPGDYNTRFIWAISGALQKIKENC